MRVVALNKFEYANKLRLPGEEFDTDNDEHARVLVLAERVKLAEPKDNIIQNRALKADAKQNRYRHRAMRTDE
jgi:hypothetical protein